MDAEINSPGNLAAEKARARGNKYSKEKRRGLATMNTVAECIEHWNNKLRLNGLKPKFLVLSPDMYYRLELEMNAPFGRHPGSRMVAYGDWDIVVIQGEKIVQLSAGDLHL